MHHHHTRPFGETAIRLPIIIIVCSKLVKVMHALIFTSSLSSSLLVCNIENSIGGTYIHLFYLVNEQFFFVHIYFVYFLVAWNEVLIVQWRITKKWWRLFFLSKISLVVKYTVSQGLCQSLLFYFFWSST